MDRLDHKQRVPVVHAELQKHANGFEGTLVVVVACDSVLSMRGVAVTKAFA